MLVNGIKKAKLEALPLAFSDWLAANGQHPSTERLDSLSLTLQSDVLRAIGRQGAML